MHQSAMGITEIRLPETSIIRTQGLISRGNALTAKCDEERPEFPTSIAASYRCAFGLSQESSNSVTSVCK